MPSSEEDSCLSTVSLLVQWMNWSFFKWRDSFLRAACTPTQTIVAQVCKQLMVVRYSLKRCSNRLGGKRNVPTVLSFQRRSKVVFNQRDEHEYFTETRFRLRKTLVREDSTKEKTVKEILVYSKYFADDKKSHILQYYRSLLCCPACTTL